MKEFRVDIATYIVFLSVGAIPLAIYVAAIIQKPGATSWQLNAIYTIYFAWVFIGLRRYRIQLHGDLLTYRSPLGRTRTIRVSTIERFTECFGDYTHFNDRGKPYHRLEIYPRAGTGDRPIVINLKVFRRDDVSYLLHYLESRYK